MGGISADRKPKGVEKIVNSVLNWKIIYVSKDLAALIVTVYLQISRNNHMATTSYLRKSYSTLYHYAPRLWRWKLGKRFFEYSSSISHPSFPNDGGRVGDGLWCHRPCPFLWISTRRAPLVYLRSFPIPQIVTEPQSFPFSGPCCAKCILCCMAGCLVGCCSPRLHICVMACKGKKACRAHHMATSSNWLDFFRPL